MSGWAGGCAFREERAKGRTVSAVGTPVESAAAQGAEEHRKKAAGSWAGNRPMPGADRVERRSVAPERDRNS